VVNVTQISTTDNSYITKIIGHLSRSGFSNLAWCLFSIRADDDKGIAESRLMFSGPIVT